VDGRVKPGHDVYWYANGVGENRSRYPSA